MASVEFELLAGRSYVARGPCNIGLYKPEGEGAILIDAGNDEDAGRKLLRALEQHGQRLACIALTHSNADHAGGAAYLKNRTGCRVAATRLEAAVAANPELEPSMLWGGFPHPALRNKFLMAPPVLVDELLEAPCPLGITGITARPLPGHFLGMVGYLTPDRVFYAADCLASEEILAKYHVFFYYDVAAALETLAALEGIEAEWFVPSHAAPTRDIKPLAEANRAEILGIAGRILEEAAQPRSQEELFAALIRRLGIELNHSQYVLVGSTFRSYLSWLMARNELRTWFEGGRLYLEAAKGAGGQG